MAAASESDDGKSAIIESHMYYLERLPLYDVEKPYSMRYMPEDGIPQSNYTKIKCPITVQSMRGPGSGPFLIDECGFQVEKLHSGLSYDEFWDNQRVQQVYIEEVKQVLKKVLGAKYVHVLDYAVSVQCSCLGKQIVVYVL